MRSIRPKPTLSQIAVDRWRERSPKLSMTVALSWKFIQFILSSRALPGPDFVERKPPLQNGDRRQTLARTHPAQPNKMKHALPLFDKILAKSSPFGIRARPGARFPQQRFSHEPPPAKKQKFPRGSVRNLGSWAMTSCCLRLIFANAPCKPRCGVEALSSRSATQAWQTSLRELTPFDKKA